jgi:predicted phage terminase large subunit-like protein
MLNTESEVQTQPAILDDSFTDLEKDQFIQFVREQEIALCRQSFWHFCKTLEPDFYTESRWHLRLICDTLQGIYDGTLINKETGKAYKKLLMSIPPRMGKSRTLVNFSRWLFGKDTKNKVITASYNDEMAVEFSRFTRDGIRDKKTYPHEIDYNDVFPHVNIKQGNASFHQWALEGEFFNYKGAGVNGGLTGKGCNVAICDDLVKDAATAYNDIALKKIWDWYTGTFLSRREKGCIEIVNMTRWSKNDVIGRIRQTKAFKDWYVLELAIVDKHGNLLCEELFDQEMYEFSSNAENFDPIIFSANYLQIPVDLLGSLYKLNIYPKLPGKFKKIYAYADTADEGNDYLSFPVFGDGGDGFLYFLDWIYTKDNMTTTDKESAEMLARLKPDYTWIEGNNGGAYYTTQVIRITREDFGFRSGKIVSFHQSGNKLARIRSTANTANNIMLYPPDFSYNPKYAELYGHLLTFKPEGKIPDDGPDSIAGLIEKYEEFKKKSGHSKNYG